LVTPLSHLTPSLEPALEAIFARADDEVFRDFVQNFAGLD